MTTTEVEQCTDTSPSCHNNAPQCRTIDSLTVECRLEAFLSRARVQLSPDGVHLYCASDDKLNRVSTQSGRVTATMHTPEDAPLTFSMSVDGGQLVSAHVSGLLRLWKCSDASPHGENHDVSGDTPQWAPAVTWKSLQRGPVAALQFDPASGSLVASGGVDGSLRVWDVVHGHCTHSLRDASVAGVVSTLAFYQPSCVGAAQDVLLLGSGDGGGIVGWSLSKSSVALRLTPGHFSKVTALCVLQSRDQAVSAGRDKVLMLWDLRTAALLRTLAIHESCEHAALLHVQDDERRHLLATVGELGRVRVWCLDSGRCVMTGGESGESARGAVVPLCHVHVAHDVGHIATVTHQCTVTIYQLADVERAPGSTKPHARDERRLLVRRQLVGRHSEVLDAVFCAATTPDASETHVVVATAGSCELHLYCCATLHCQLVRGHDDCVLALAACAADRRLIASASKDATVRVWRLTSMPVAGAAAETRVSVQCVAVGSGHTAGVTTLAWSCLTADWLVSGAEDRCVKIWRVPASCRNLDDGDGETVAVSLSCHFSHIGHDKQVTCVCVAPNDKLLAAASQDRTVSLYRRGVSGAGQWSVTAPLLRGHSRAVWHAAFSPVDQVLATASADCTLRLWAVSDGSCVRTFSGHDASVLRVMFVGRGGGGSGGGAGGGQQLMSSGADGFIKLWTVRSGECTDTLSQHAGAKVWTLAASACQQRFVSGGGEGAGDAALVLWRDSTSAQRQRSTREAARRLLHQQKLANLLRDGRLLAALRLAINLRRPLACLDIMRRLSGDGAELDALLNKLRDDQVATLLEFAVEWNTNSRHCVYAQLLVHRLLRHRAPSAWRQLPGHRQLLEQLLPYTERHVQRLKLLRRSVAFFDYTLACMKTVPDSAVSSRVEETTARHTVNTDTAGVVEEADMPAQEQCEVDEAMLEDGREDDATEGEETLDKINVDICQDDIQQDDAEEPVQEPKCSTAVNREDTTLPQQKTGNKKQRRIKRKLVKPTKKGRKQIGKSPLNKNSQMKTRVKM